MQFDNARKIASFTTNLLVSGDILKSIKKSRTPKGYITFSKLTSCLNNKPYYKGIKLVNNKSSKISGWKISNKVK